MRCVLWGWMKLYYNLRPFFEIFSACDFFWVVVKQVARCPCLFGKLPRGYQYLNRLFGLDDFLIFKMKFYG